MNHYLVRLGAAWIDVRGEVDVVGFLRWHDRRGGLNSSGIAFPGEYLPHYPRLRSDKEKGIGITREVIE